MNGQAARQEQPGRGPVRGDVGGMAVVELLHLETLNDRRRPRSRTPRDRRKSDTLW